MTVFLRILIPLFAFLVITPSLISQNFNMDGTPINSCTGFFLDSGGSNSNYASNESLTTVICPDGSGGTHIQLLFAGVDLASGDIMCFFDGQDANANQLSCSDEFDPGAPFIIQATAANSSGCVTVTFNSNGSDEGQGWSANINCITSCQTIEAVIVSSDPPVAPADTGWIDACPGDRIVFNGAGNYPQNGIAYNHSDFTSTFEWDFGDGSSAVGPSVSHIYDEPGGYVVELTITDQMGCKNTNFLSQRVRIAGPPSFPITGNYDDEICPGDTVSLSASVDMISSDATISVLSGGGAFKAGGVRSDTLALPDGTGAVYSTSIGITDFLPGQTITNPSDIQSICVNMEHSWMHDLDLFLTCPDGTQIILQRQEFITNEVFLGAPFELDDTNTPDPPGQGIGFQYCFTPSASHTWTEYTQEFDPQTLPEGDYLPFEPLDGLLGCPINGEWTIIVQDQWASDNGWIFEWSINFNPAIIPNLEVFETPIIDFNWSSDPTIFSQTQNAISALPQTAGMASYTFNATDEFGCTWDTTLTLTVLPQTHPDCYNCADLISPPPDTIVCEGESVTLDVTSQVPLETEIQFLNTPGYEFGFSNHPPLNPYQSIINVNSIAPPLLLNPNNQIVSVCIDIETDWNSDLLIFLRAPSGQLLELSTENGGSTDNYTNTCFTPTATTSIETGTGPFTGEFSPEGSWLLLTGTPINGDWALIVSDEFGVNQLGVLNSWSITFNSINDIQYTWQSPPQGPVDCTTCPVVNVTPDVTLDYSVTANDAYGCSDTETINVGVVNDASAPNVTCQSNDNNGSITFNWDAISGFTQYEVNPTINGTEQGWQGPIDGLTFTVDNLSNRDMVTLQVRVFTGNIPLSCVVEIGSASCEYIGCSLAGNLVRTTPVTCFGGTEGTVEVTAMEGDPAYTFFLDGSTNGQATGAFSSLTGGDHFVVVGDTKACFDTVFFTIQEPDSLTLAITLDQPVSCFGDSDAVITASANGGNGDYQFSWDNVNSVSATLTDLSANTYQVRVADQLGCETTNSITIENPEALNLSLDPTDASCANLSDGTIETTAMGGTGTLSYNWDNGSMVANQSDLAPQTYCVSVTDERGCQEIQCAEILAPTELIIDSISFEAVKCFGNNDGAATVFASGGTGEYTYAWNDSLLAQISPTASLLPSDDYTVTVTDENGCQATGQIFLPEPEALIVGTEITDALCNGGADGTAAALPSGGTEPYRYNWDNGQTESKAINLMAGDYQVMVIDANGCETSAQARVGEPENAVVADIVQTFQGCFGTSSNEAIVNPSGGTGSDYTFQWSNGQVTQTAIGLDSIMYSVTVIDGNQCEAVGEITLADLEDINFEIQTVLPSCFGSTDGDLGVNIITGGAGTDPSDYSFSWSNGRSGPIVNNVPGGITYSVTVTDPQGCEKEKSRLLGQPTEITFDITPTTVSCFAGDDGTATVNNVQGDNGSYTYQWDINANQQNNPTATNLRAGTYQVTVTDGNGCFSVNSVEVTQPGGISVSLDNENNKCFGDREGSIQANVNGGVPSYQYNWSNGANTANLNSLASGDYVLTVTDRNGCEEISQVTITEPVALDITLDKKDVTCFGDRDGSIFVNVEGGTPPFKYSLDNEKFTTSSTLIGLTAGLYNVFILDDNGCRFTDNIEIIDPPEFTVNAGQDVTITLGDSIQLFAVSKDDVMGVEFVWSAPYGGTLSCTECPDPFTNTQNTITYELYGVDGNGCEDTDLIKVMVEKPRVVAVPTGFTPNDDAINDLLMVHGRTGTTITLFQIYDRWGELVYEGRDFQVNDPTIGWDGNFKGKPMNAGVYVWYLEAEYIDGVQESFRGQTTLIR